MITVMGKMLRYGLYYGEVRVLGRPVLCTIPSRSPSVAVNTARELMGVIG